MNDWPRITIITPSFNQALFLEATIQSVLDQGYPNLEFGIVDGGSTDGSIDIINRYRKDLAFALIESDRGQAHAINKGLARASGDIIGWLCSDDLLLPGALRAVGGAFAASNEITWVAGGCRMMDVGGETLSTIQPRGDFTVAGVLLRDQTHRPFDLPQPGVFWRRSLHDTLGPLDESLHYCMDFEFWLRLVAAGHRPHVIDRTLAAYRLHSDSKTCAMASGFLREHILVERRYRQHLTWPQRIDLWRRLGYMRRACAVREADGRPWAAVLRRPWWLLSQQVRAGLGARV